MNASTTKRDKRRRGSSRNLAGVFFTPTELKTVTARPGVNNVEPIQELTTPIETGADAPLRAAAVELRRKLDPGHHRIITAVGCEDVLFQTLELPTEDASELKQMLDLQMDNITPLPMEDVVYDFMALEAGQGKTRVLVAVARKDVVNERVAALETAGLPPETVTTDALAVFRALLARKLVPDDEKYNVLLLLNALAANIIVFSNQKPRAVRSVMIEAEILTDAESLAGLLAELHRTLVSAGADQPHGEMGLLTVLTWEESLRPVAEEIARVWDGRAELLNNGSAPGPALSLCLEQAGSGASLNLLPEEWRQSRQAARRRQTIIRAGIGVLLVYLAGLVGFLGMLTLKRNELAEIQREVRSLQGPHNEALRLKAELLATQRMMDPKYAALELIREISVKLPPDVQLNLFSLKAERIDNKDRKLARVRGKAKSFDLIHTYIGNLQKSEQFESVESPGKFTTLPDGWTSFDIVCTLKTVTGGPD